MFPDFWTSDLVFRRMVVQLRRMAFLNKMYSPRGKDFCPPISKSSVGTPLFYFISWVYIYWITSVQTFTKIWVQVLFGWNDIKFSCSLANHIFSSSSSFWTLSPDSSHCSSQCATPFWSYSTHIKVDRELDEEELQLQDQWASMSSLFHSCSLQVGRHF